MKEDKQRVRRGVLIGCALLIVGSGATASAVAFSQKAEGAGKADNANTTVDRDAILRAEKRSLARLHAQLDPLRRDARKAMVARRQLLHKRRERHLFAAPTTPDAITLRIINDEAFRWSILNGDPAPTKVTVYSSTMKAAAFAIDGTIEMVDAGAPVYVAVIDGSFTSGVLPGTPGESVSRMVLVFDAVTMFERELAYVGASFSPGTAFGAGLVLSPELPRN